MQGRIGERQSSMSRNGSRFDEEWPFRAGRGKKEQGVKKNKFLRCQEGKGEYFD